MNCPDCGKEMREGYIASQDFLVWFPSKHVLRWRDFWTKNTPRKKGGEILARKSGFIEYLTQVPGWICPHCKKAVFDWREDQVSYTRRF